MIWLGYIRVRDVLAQCQHDFYDFDCWNVSGTMPHTSPTLTTYPLSGKFSRKKNVGSFCGDMIDTQIFVGSRVLIGKMNALVSPIDRDGESVCIILQCLCTLAYGQLVIETVHMCACMFIPLFLSTFLWPLVHWPNYTWNPSIWSLAVRLVFSVE